MKNYLVVGASSGIGRATAKQLVNEGFRVFGTYNKTNSDLDENIIWHPLNVIEETLNLEFLPPILDGVVFCPGSIQLRPFERIKASDFENDFRLQVLGAIKTLQAVMPRLKASGNASVVLFSTVAVQTGLPFHTQVSMSKGAIEGLTKAMAAEYAPTVRFNCIAPSLTDTPLAAALLNNEQKREANALRHPMKKIGTAQDISEMTCFLLSEKAGWITGQVLHVDGGISTIKN